MSRFRHVELQYASRLVNAGGIRPAAGGYRGG
ncbi:Uncharacterised protein [Klebsiella pneumoniae]|nr:Uncharacterised protein [Klebsiella pneumoniae]